MSDMAGIAGNAVSVYQQALTTVSNNIANVATDGYSRQDVKLSALPVTLTGNVFLGSGVMVDRVQRQYNEFVERNLRNTVSDLASQEPMVSYANRVVDIMGGESMGLSSALDRFFESARALSGDASSTSCVRRTASLLVSASFRASSTWWTWKPGNPWTARSPRSTSSQPTWHW